jgi:hypothetical protein
MGERIRKRFKPTDTVKVHNLTNQSIEWQWLEESDETYTIEDGSNIKIVERKDPGLWRLGPGEQDILQGSCAYIMIEALYKQMAVMKTGIVLHPLDEREIKNFGFDDPQKQEEMIDLIFRGKVTPQMMAEAAASSLGGMKPNITEHLPDLANERSEYAKRMRDHGPREAAPADTPILDKIVAPAPDEQGSNQPSRETELKDLGKEFDETDKKVDEEKKNGNVQKQTAQVTKGSTTADSSKPKA